jgi:hypothetical protein
MVPGDSNVTVAVVYSSTLDAPNHEALVAQRFETRIDLGKHFFEFGNMREN